MAVAVDPRTLPFSLYGPKPPRYDWTAEILIGGCLVASLLLLGLLSR